MNSADMLGGGETHTGSYVKSVCLFTLGATFVVGIAFVAVMALAAPDGIVMKTAVQAIVDQQQAVAVAYLQ